MKMKLGKTMGLIAAALLPLAGLAAARPAAECEAMMKANAYCGMWLEKSYSETWRIAFGTNGVGVMVYRLSPVRFTWTSDGTGEIRLKDADDPEAEPLPSVRYDPAHDTMDMGLGGEKTPSGFTGRLVYEQEELFPWMQRGVDYPLPEPPKALDPAGRLEKLKAERPKGFRRVDSLLEELDPIRRLEAKSWVETVDLDYPRVDDTRPRMSSNRVEYKIVYGRYEKDPMAVHREMEGERKSRAQRPDDPPCQIGPNRARVNELCKELDAKKMYYRRMSYDFGKGGEYWREDAIYIGAYAEQFETMKRLLREYLFADSNCPRYILEVPSEDYYSASEKTLYKVDWTSGKPVLVLER